MNVSSIFNTYSQTPEQHISCFFGIIAFFFDFCKERIFKILSKMSKFSLWLRNLERFFGREFHILERFWKSDPKLPDSHVFPFLTDFKDRIYSFQQLTSMLPMQICDRDTPKSGLTWGKFSPIIQKHIRRIKTVLLMTPNVERIQLRVKY